MKCNFKKFSWLLILLLFVYPVFAEEEQSEEQEEENNEDSYTFIDTTAAVWLTDIMEDSSKAEEYGQLPSGFLINQFNVEMLMANGRFLNMDGERVGLNNAHYGFDYGMSGKYALRIDYLKIPHLFSKSGETIWIETSPGTWSLADNIQQTIQNLNNVDPTDPTYNAGLFAQRTYVSNLLNASHAQSLDLQRNRGNIALEHSLNAAWKLGVDYFQENRDGNRPFGTSLGFSWATEVPEHLDYRTQNIHAGAEYSKNGKSLMFAYDLSLFHNEILSTIWDNPLRFDDRTFSTAYTNGDGTSRGRVQLAPNNTANTISIGGASKVGRGRITGSFAYSLWTDDVDLLPFTIKARLLQSRCHLQHSKASRKS